MRDMRMVVGSHRDKQRRTEAMAAEMHHHHTPRPQGRRHSRPMEHLRDLRHLSMAPPPRRQPPAMRLHTAPLRPPSLAGVRAFRVAGRARGMDTGALLPSPEQHLDSLEDLTLMGRPEVALVAHLLLEALDSPGLHLASLEARPDSLVPILTATIPRPNSLEVLEETSTDMETDLRGSAEYV
jgi:hypothetical protein